MKYQVTPYVVDMKASVEMGVVVVTDAKMKTVEATSSVEAALKNRPGKTAFWHVRSTQ